MRICRTFTFVFCVRRPCDVGWRHVILLTNHQTLNISVMMRKISHRTNLKILLWKWLKASLPRIGKNRTYFCSFDVVREAFIDLCWHGEFLKENYEYDLQKIGFKTNDRWIRNVEIFVRTRKHMWPAKVMNSCKPFTVASRGWPPNTNDPAKTSIGTAKNLQHSIVIRIRTRVNEPTVPCRKEECKWNVKSLFFFIAFRRGNTAWQEPKKSYDSHNHQTRACRAFVRTHNERRVSKLKWHKYVTWLQSET